MQPNKQKLSILLSKKVISKTKSFYLYSKCTKNNGAENWVPEDTIKHVPLSVYFASIDFIKQLHHDEGVEDDGVMLRRRRVERSVAAAVDIKYLLTWREQWSVCIQPALCHSTVKLQNNRTYRQKAAWRWEWAGRPRGPRCSWSWCWRWGAYCGRTASSSAETLWEVLSPGPETQRCPWLGWPTTSALLSAENPGVGMKWKPLLRSKNFQENLRTFMINVPFYNSITFWNKYLVFVALIG